MIPVANHCNKNDPLHNVSGSFSFACTAGGYRRALRPGAAAHVSSSITNVSSA